MRLTYSFSLYMFSGPRTLLRSFVLYFLGSMGKCCREQAISAKDSALMKMDVNDFSSAQGILLQAQKICPDLEHISQLLTICDVHCTAKKIVKKAIDWYEVLQVDVAADESIIKRQYRKLVKLVHPDKNKFPGAEAAFKLVAEAYSILGDATNRAIYDTRRKSVSRTGPSKVGQQQWKTAGGGSKPGSAGLAFWTICPHCGTRYQYHIRVLDKGVCCQSCCNVFSTSRTRSPIQQCGTPSKQSHPVNYSSEGRNKELKPKNSVDGWPMLEYAEVNVHGGKKLRQEDESIVPVVEGSSCMDAEGNISMQNCTNKKRQRKNYLPSNVATQHNEILRSNVCSANRDPVFSHDSRSINIGDGTQTSPTSDDQSIIAEDACTFSCNFEVLSVPHPGIMFRDVNSIFKSAGQIWALFGNRDGMPRLYAQIKYIDESNSKVHLNWLRKKKGERKWTANGLPVACGKFCLGRRDVLEDNSQFSHVVEWKNDKRRKMCEIYPNKGQVWALFKEWNRELSSANDRYKYEVVQLKSNMTPTNGATVLSLIRIAGFVSLFATAKDKSPFNIPSTEVHRFSHRIPFYRTAGNEKDIPRKRVFLSKTKEHVPRGFLQLDTSCIPADHAEAFPSVTLDYYMALSNKASSDIFGDNQSGDGLFQQECQASNIYECPDPEFHNFEESCLNEKFQRGQIWALYSDVDKFPNLYGQIDKVETEPFRVHLNWLDACTQSEQEKWWMEKERSISCGMFKVRDSTTLFVTTDVFSHLLDAKEMNEECQLEIFPRVGEIWVVYMNWPAPDSAPSTIACEYAVGEIIECTEVCTKISMLTKVDGYISVFKPANEKEILEIPVHETLRFSHRVPSFHLTKERGGKLSGFYELDPASVPDCFMCGNVA